MFFQDPPYTLIGLLLSFLHDKSLSGFLFLVLLVEYSTSITFLDRRKEKDKKVSSFEAHSFRRKILETKTDRFSLPWYSTRQQKGAMENLLFNHTTNETRIGL